MEQDFEAAGAEAPGNLSQLEIARIIGEPKDPRRPYSDLVDKVCETFTTNPEDYDFYFDVLEDTDKVYIVTSTGAITQENVTPDTPVQLSYADLFSPEYYIKYTDMVKRKEQVIARKLITINRSMNAYENYKIIQLIDAAVQTANQFDLDSGVTTFTFPKLIDMIEAVVDYGDNYVLIAGANIMKDITLWDFNENKFQSVKQAFEDLSIEQARVGTAQVVTIDGGATSVLSTNVGYLCARDTEVGKPLIFVRKKLDDLKLLGGNIYANGDRPERLVFTSPNPITVDGVGRYPAYAVMGFEEITGAVKNPYGLTKFSRA